MNKYILKGRVWKFDDNINTDLMMPNTAFLASPEEQRKMVFESIRPGWSLQVKEGDILVAGNNFGTGSSRPGARLLRELGIVAIVADSINGLFLRNCINFGVIGLSCPGVSAAFEEGEIAEIHALEGTVYNLSQSIKQPLLGQKFPENLVELALAGGIRPLLEREGYIS
jgi:3-isopropylmalate/(R)-2-methylmalate dehydratase small subunit